MRDGSSGNPFFRRLCRLALCGAAALGVLWIPPAAAQAPWSWPASFSENSARELVDLHASLLAPSTLAGVSGYRVAGARWQAPAFTLEMDEGALYLEPAVDGRSVGALFVGRGRFTFDPEDQVARHAASLYFCGAPPSGVEVEAAYFFLPGGVDLQERFGVQGDPDAPPPGDDAVAPFKAALRQRGLWALYAFLNGEGIAGDTQMVILQAPSVRTPGSEHALLAYTLDSLSDHEIGFWVFGHKDVAEDPELRFYFYPVALAYASPSRYQPDAAAETYRVELALKGTRDATETTTIRLLPSPGARALRLQLTPRVQVAAVRRADGTPLPHGQFRWLREDFNPDPSLVVDLGEDGEDGEPVEIIVEAAGPLFDAVDGAFWLADEDRWFPSLNALFPATYEIIASVPKGETAVAPGELVETREEEGRRVFHYRTRRPYRRATFYYGEFDHLRERADATQVEIFAPKNVIAPSDLKHAAAEVANMVRVYNRIFRSLDVPTLRVASTPTSHGRGFEGLILLSQRAGFRSDLSAVDVFRAHEVAHQWWGNMVDGRRWPEDRWISESFAEYAAMEYYDVRFQKPKRTLQQMQQLWVKPVMDAPAVTVECLTGGANKIPASEILPLTAGPDVVYTKGPLVLHMLRYLFKVHKKNEDGFWELLQDFLEKHEYRTATTEDFMRLTEQHMQGRLDWFWNQWLFDTRIPTVTWSYEVTRAEDGNWLLTVEAEQKDTEFVLAIPVYVSMGGRTMSAPMILRGKKGGTRIKMAQKPSKVSLNDGFEALVRLRRR